MARVRVHNLGHRILRAPRVEVVRRGGIAGDDERVLPGAVLQLACVPFAVGVRVRLLRVRL